MNKTHMKQRLVLCLDGTWNTEDDSTNVLHHYHLAAEGPCAGAIQKLYYDRGVGTGVFESFRGGVLGLGLSQNVREAYQWLMDHYIDGDDIFIFGFSRGSYTARSLVGFIASCGLLRKGAPLTVNQLWNNYKQLDSDKERSQRNNQRPDNPQACRRLTYLESCKGGQATLEMSEAEQAILQWSRRVDIDYLGLYDTVGALGRDALAIPGIKSKHTRYHDMRPSSRIQHCRHALAIDEYRSPFNHTPFVAHVGDEFAEQESGRLLGTSATTSQADAQLAAWNQRIQQRWFVGAHSNIGGGYANNWLATAPLRWVLAGATEQGLVLVNDAPYTEHNPKPPAVTANRHHITDSFAAFARGLPRTLLLAKPHYRRIDPPAQATSIPKKCVTTGSKECLKSAHKQSVNEALHASVGEVYHATCSAQSDQAAKPLPPHLYEYCQRQLRRPRSQPEASGLPETPIPEPLIQAVSHPLGFQWLPDFSQKTTMIWLVLWATLAAFGLHILNQQFGLLLPEALTLFLPAYSATIIGLEWLESRSIVRLALYPDSPRRKAFVQSIFWVRSAAVFSFLIGLLALIWIILRAKYQWLITSPAQAAEQICAAFANIGWALLGCALTASITLMLLRKAQNGTWLNAPVSSRSGPDRMSNIAKQLRPKSRQHLRNGLLLLAVVTLLAIVCVNNQTMAGWARQSATALAGVLCVLLTLLAPALKTLAATSLSMRQINAGEVLDLQNQKSLADFRQWQADTQANTWAIDQTSQPDQLRKATAEALWVDTFSLVPAYSVVFLLSLWILIVHLWPASPLWLLLPIWCAALDITENLLQRSFLDASQQQDTADNQAWFKLARLATKIKNGLFAMGTITTVVVIIWGSIQVWCDLEVSGWQGDLLITGWLLWGLWMTLAAAKAIQQKGLKGAISAAWLRVKKALPFWQ